MPFFLVQFDITFTFASLDPQHVDGRHSGFGLVVFQRVHQTSNLLLVHHGWKRSNDYVHRHLVYLCVRARVYRRRDLAHASTYHLALVLLDHLTLRLLSRRSPSLRTNFVFANLLASRIAFALFFFTLERTLSYIERSTIDKIRYCVRKELQYMHTHKHISPTHYCTRVSLHLVIL